MKNGEKLEKKNNTKTKMYLIKSVREIRI